MSIIERFRTMNPQLRLFLAGIMLLGAAGGIYETTFNNFLSDTFNISADTRGFLEFPRELPGFLTALFAGMLFFLPETLIAAGSSLMIGLGMIGLAAWGSSWPLMMSFMILWSAGTHMMMPVHSSVAIHLASSLHRGRRLGQIAGAAIAATLIGCGAVWVSMKYFDAGYSRMFSLGGVSALIASVFFAQMRLPEAHLKRPRFVWNRKYRLFYVLAFLFGARKQVFITFGPWVLVRIFDQPAYIIAQLWFAAAAIGILFHPFLGKLIDRVGERTVLMVDAVLVFAVCAGYGFSHAIDNRTAALWLLYGCYVGDHLLFGANIARTTYLSRIAEQKEDMAPTLSLGISINHAVSMSMPALGGLMWIAFGHTSVFIAAAGIAAIMFIFTTMLPRQSRSQNREENHGLRR